jgi:hypothetical protein
MLESLTIDLAKLTSESHAIVAALLAAQSIAFLLAVERIGPLR